MSKRGDREVDVFLREAERRWACLESYPGHLHRLLERRVQNGELVSPPSPLRPRRPVVQPQPDHANDLHRARSPGAAP